MKNVILFCTIVFTLFSCNQKPNSTLEEPTTKAVETSAKVSKSSMTVQQIQQIQIDSVFNNTIQSVNAFVDQNGDNDGLEDVWWDSKKPSDKAFNRIRLCKSIGSALIIERRPFPFSSDLDVLGYKIDREYKNDSSYIYFIESSHYKHNKEIASETKHYSVTTLEEMILATEIFHKRLQEAHENLSNLNGKDYNKKTIQAMSKNG